MKNTVMNYFNKIHAVITWGCVLYPTWCLRDYVIT